MNYSFSTGNTLPEVPVDKIFKDCNFTQLLPNTLIFEGVMGLVFENCNLVNCTVPPDATLISCMRSQIDFCSHLHPKWIKKGLPLCDDECRHMVSKDILEIDGVILDTVYTYEDKGA